LKRVSKLKLEYGVEIFTISILFLLAFIAEEIGLSAVLIAYAYGIGLASHRYFASRKREAVGLISALFAPLFFIYVGYKLNIGYLMKINLASIAYLIIMIVLFGFISKIVGCYVFSRIVGLSHRSSLLIGVGMVPRSEVAMISASLA